MGVLARRERGNPELVIKRVGVSPISAAESIRRLLFPTPLMKIKRLSR